MWLVPGTQHFSCQPFASSTFLQLHPSFIYLTPHPNTFLINMDGMNAVYAQDEYGRPFIILREQQKKSRLSGIEAQKVILTKHSSKYSSIILISKNYEMSLFNAC